LGLVFPNDIAALQTSPEPVAEELSQNMLLACVEKPIQQQFETWPAFWKIKINRLLELRKVTAPRHLRLSHAYRARAHVHAGGQKNGIASHDVRLQRSELRVLPLVIEPRFAIVRIEQHQAGT
jgi:hypothetical protein